MVLWCVLLAMVSLDTMGMRYEDDPCLGEVNVFGTPCDSVTPYWERHWLEQRGECCILDQGTYFVGRSDKPHRFWDWAIADWYRAGKPKGLHPSDVWLPRYASFSDMLAGRPIK